MAAGREPAGDFSRGFETLVYEEHVDDEEHPPYLQSNRHQVSMFTGRCDRLVAVSLVLLAAFLLILDIGLGVYYNKLTDMHLSPDDTERIGKELADLQHTYKAAVETMKDARKQLDSEMSFQTKTNWELEHQTKRSNDYKSQIETFTKQIKTMGSRLPMISDGCKHCPAGWIFMNSACYYFSFLHNGHKTWTESRDFCQLYGGDLIIINSKDEENSTLSYLINHHNPEHHGSHRVARDVFYMGHSLMYDYEDYEDEIEIAETLSSFWIGLSDSQEEGNWKWWDGTGLNEGFWSDGEPSDGNNEDCVAVDSRVNFFKAWSDVRCDARMKWICEKAATSTS